MNKGYYTNYIYGNAAPVDVFFPKRTLEEVPAVRERSNTKSDSKLRDIPYIIILAIATAAIVFICYNYLGVQSEITTSIKTIEQQEATIAMLKNDNDALETRINTQINLEEVYNIASSQLGMVYAEKGQVIRYDRSESEYVRQYEDIPR